LAVILNKLSAAEVSQLAHKFGFKKGESIRLVSIKENQRVIRELSGKAKPSRIYNLLNQLSYETIIFYYACSQDKKVRKNIIYFMDKLSHLRLKIKGEDLKKAGLLPQNLYGKVLTELLEAKMDENIDGKDQELKLAAEIIDKLKRC